MPDAKPEKRADSEDKATNIARYQLGSFGPDATGTLGVNVVYPQSLPQGVTITKLLASSSAEAGGLKLHDIILEVDSSAVGRIGERLYEPWRRYGRGEPDIAEVLVSFVSSNGTRKCYYPQLKVPPVYAILVTVPPKDFFTAEKPLARTAPEDELQNEARYTFGAANFETYSPYELGVDVVYGSDGGRIKSIKTNGAADKAGLKVGDIIMEIDGCPVGKFGTRLYELWRQYFFSSGNVELLVAFKPSPSSQYRFYYPTVTLDKREGPI